MKPFLGLAAIALGAAHIALAEKRHRESQHLAFVRLHSDLARDTAGDARFTEIINADLYAHLDVDGRAQMVTANRWVSLWSAMLRLGFITRASARQIADTFMQSETNRSYWKLASNYRRTGARDRHDERFIEIMADSYANSQAA
ncbi:hypothetical protein ASD97_10250 [Streptomyces sp. Root63]|uniref:DUF6082 family protein n=1 Tax=unclassified Streptomyces TaxID=2593676 RepID=UPI0006FC6C7F|nr:MULTISPECIES: DUF6082 family protein [unclassified Streptomyces]KQX36959.1 hypothetical protein ASD29_06980 [Streptomyces sp. Root1295]KRA43979.1 hypothetical protein ASD97_10250 [Streptomyces sp. Root63]